MLNVNSIQDDTDKFVVGTIEGDFFEQNPHLKYRTPCVEVIEELGGERASRFMWGIYLMCDPDSRFFSMREDKRREEVKKNYWKGRRFKEPLVEKMISEYPKMAMSFKARMYMELKEKMEEVVSSSTNNKDKIALMSKLDSMYKGLDRAEAAFNQEKATRRKVRGKDQTNSAIARAKEKARKRLEIDKKNK